MKIIPYYLRKGVVFIGLFVLCLPVHADIYQAITSLNQQLQKNNFNFQVVKVEYITDASSNQAGRTLFFSNRGNKQLSSHYVPYDPRRFGVQDIHYITDGTELATILDENDTYNAIDSAMTTWDSVKCSNIPLVNLGIFKGFDIGIIQDYFGYGGNPAVVLAEITHAGFLPATFFDILQENGGQFILAVTFTLAASDENGLTDINNDGKDDTWFTEIYYNDAVNWVLDANDTIYTPGVDLETVALHEAGHALSQGHFGSVSYTQKKQKLHFSPLSVMNAGYGFAQQSIEGTDKAGHCSLWGKWPNK